MYSKLACFVITKAVKNMSAPRGLTRFIYKYDSM